MNRTRLSPAVLLAGTALFLTGQAFAQTGGNPGWFIPGQSSAGGHPAAHARAPGHAAAAEPSPLQADQGVPGEGAAPVPPVQMQLPPAPAVPDVQRGSMPPAAVIGVISIPDVLRASSAYREADKAVAERRQKLNDDAQKEQVALRDLGQKLANERSKLSAEQIRAREKELQDRITESRRKFTERGRIIQEASQYALAQIERTLSEVVQKVAGSRGMNLVLQRAEVALNQAEFDITPEVANMLNKALPTVVIPPEGVEPPLAANASAKPPASAPEKTAETRPARGAEHTKPAHH